MRKVFSFTARPMPAAPANEVITVRSLADGEVALLVVGTLLRPATAPTYELAIALAVQRSIVVAVSISFCLKACALAAHLAAKLV